MISVDKAVGIIAESISALPNEAAAVESSVGRTLASAPVAQLTHPPARMSAMDGYAISLTTPIGLGTTFDVIGEAPAGTPFQGTVSDDAVRVFTGSVIPDGANHVIIQEEVSRDQDIIQLTAEQTEPRNVRQMGTDFSVGDPLLSQGTVLAPLDLSLLASAGITKVELVRKPKIALFANGDELVEPGQTPALGQVVNSITRGLKPLLESWGAEVEDLGVARDSQSAVEAMFERAAEADLIIPIGGASVGDYDLVKQLGRQLFDLSFEKVAVKPGKPVWFGRNETSTILGLPGNPSSAFACAHIFVHGAINAFLGRPNPTLNLATARLSAPVGPNGNRENFLRARVHYTDDGSLSVSVSDRQDTALLSPFAASNALLRRMANAEAAVEGEQAQVLLLES